MDLKDRRGSFLVTAVVTVGSKNGVDRKMDRNKSRTDLLAAGKKKVCDLCNINFNSCFVKCVCVCVWRRMKCSCCVSRASFS